MFHARLFVAVLILPAALSAAGSAQSAPSSTAACNLDDGRQVRINYNAVSTKNDKAPNGKPWSPGGAPMTLFTEAPLSFAGATIPVGAYSVYPIPGKDKWTIAVNKNVTTGSAYDERENLAHGPMETDQMTDAAQALEVAFAHVGSRCTLRIYFNKTATFAEFTAK